MSDSRQSDLEAQIKTLISAKFPAFIFIRDLSSAGVASSTLTRVFSSFAQDSTVESEKPLVALVNCRACFTQKLLFDSTLTGLIGCCHESEADTKFSWLASQKNDSVDDFLHNIRSLFPRANMSEITSSDTSQTPLKLVIVLEQAERLKDTLPRQIHPLSRLQELTMLNITTIFISEDAWEAITPIPGTLSDPYIIEIEGLDKQEVIERICRRFPKDIPVDSISMFNPSLEVAFRHFVEAAYDICSPFLSDPTEHAYIVAARWPGFVSPILEDWKSQTRGPYLAPSEDTRIRLTRLFNASLMNAVESLYPRIMERKEWGEANSFPSGYRLGDSRGIQLPSATASPVDAPDSVPKLSVLSMFILVAAFLASYNPAKSDYRMFGKGADEKSRRRRKGGGARKTKVGTVAKLPQRLVGPMSFPYDRLIAILGSLLREYGDSKQLGQSLVEVSELKVEVDVYRVQTSSLTRELVSLHLIHRATVQDKLEGPSFRCGIGYDQALSIARKLGIPLNDLMWESN